MGNIQSADAIHFNIQKRPDQVCTGLFLSARSAVLLKVVSSSPPWFSRNFGNDDEQCNRFVVNSDTSQLFHRS